MDQKKLTKDIAAVVFHLTKSGDLTWSGKEGGIWVAHANGMRLELYENTLGGWIDYSLTARLGSISTTMVVPLRPIFRHDIQKLYEFLVRQKKARREDSKRRRDEVRCAEKIAILRHLENEQ